MVRRLRVGGLTQKEGSELLEIPWVTLARWNDSGEESNNQVVSSTFRPVKVTGDDPSVANPVLVSPSGWRIEGPSVAELVEVARRLQCSAKSTDPQRADEALDLIGKLYDVETRARDPDEEWALFEWRQKLREEKSKPILDELFDWAEGPPVLPRSPIGKAIKYLKARRPRLIRFVNHPEQPDRLRYPRSGRRSQKSYGSRSRRGTEVAAMMYTVFETAKICGVDPRDYIRRVVINDIDNPHTVTLPAPIEKVMNESQTDPITRWSNQPQSCLADAAAVFCVRPVILRPNGFRQRRTV